MKPTQLTILLFALISLFTYSSCLKDGEEEGDIPETIEVGTLSAKIDGEQFKSSLASGEIDPASNGFFVIGGIEDENVEEDKDFLGITFFLNSETSLNTGDYNSSDSECLVGLEVCGRIISQLDNPSIPIQETIYQTLVEGSETQINVSSIDYQPGGNAMGTFSGTLLNPNGSIVNVTEGKFNVKIRN
ncbi:MAG: hypothetical protein AB8B69_06025 [Chitinophagales bacterium]